MYSEFRLVPPLYSLWKKLVPPYSVITQKHDFPCIFSILCQSSYYPNVHTVLDTLTDLLFHNDLPHNLLWNSDSPDRKSYLKLACHVLGFLHILSKKSYKNKGIFCPALPNYYHLVDIPFQSNI